MVAADGDVRLRREQRERARGEHAEHDDVDPSSEERGERREHERTDQEALGLQGKDLVRPVVERVEAADDALALLHLRPVDEVAATGDSRRLDRDVRERQQEDGRDDDEREPSGPCRARARTRAESGPRRRRRPGAGAPRARPPSDRRRSPRTPLRTRRRRSAATKGAPAPRAALARRGRAATRRARALRGTAAPGPPKRARSRANFGTVTTSSAGIVANAACRNASARVRGAGTASTVMRQRPATTTMRARFQAFGPTRPAGASNVCHWTWFPEDPRRPEPLLLRVVEPYEPGHLLRRARDRGQVVDQRRRVDREARRSRATSWRRRRRPPPGRALPPGSSRDGCPPAGRRASSPRRARRLRRLPRP